MAESLGITVVLADDHAIVREGLAALCAANGMTILGRASDGPSSLEMILNLKPDFAILDLHMPGMTGAEVIRRLRVAGSTTKLMILTISREDSTVMEALRAGADAYLLKDGPGRHLLEAIHFVQEGGVYVSPLLKGAGLFTRAEKAPAENPTAALSPRETEVFSYLMNGLRTKDIAELLDISPKTVDIYCASLKRKLNPRGGGSSGTGGGSSGTPVPAMLLSDSKIARPVQESQAAISISRSGLTKIKCHFAPEGSGPVLSPTFLSTSLRSSCKAAAP